MIVVSNTSPLNYMVLIGAANLLADLFGEIYVPPQVIDELGDADSPAAVRNWVQTPPPWLVVRPASRAAPNWKLHVAEANAIALAKEMGADRLLIDERRGREVARREGLRVTGVLGLLDEADDKKLLDLPRALTALKATSFRVAEELTTELLRRHEERAISADE